MNVRLITIGLVLSVAVMVACQPAAHDGPNLTASAPKPAELAATRSQQSPIETLATFYDLYSNYPGNPLVTGAYRDNATLRQYQSDQFIATVDETLASFDPRGGGYDPFLCAQDFPNEFAFEPVDITDREAAITVQAIFTGGVPYEFDVQMIRGEGGWLIDAITCRVPEPVELPPTPPNVETTPAGVEDGWINYQNRDYGFQINHPAHWLVYQTEVDDPYDVDPVEGYITFSDDSGLLPVALVISTGSMEQFRLVFPEPPVSETTQTATGYEVFTEEHFGGERYMIIIDPNDDNRRVALRVIEREGSISAELESVIQTMLDSFLYLNG